MTSHHAPSLHSFTYRLVALTMATLTALVVSVACLPVACAWADEPTATTDATSATTDGKVRVAFFPLDGFYETDSAGNKTGYGTDYFNAVADFAGMDYEYVPASSWVEALQMFDEGKVDVLAPSEITAERSEKYRFCSLPLGTEYGSLLTLSTNDKLSYEDFSAFNSMKVGAVSSIVFMDRYLDYQQSNGFQTEFVYYKDTQALIAALNAGEVDAILANLMVKTDTMKVLAKFGAAPIYYMVRQDNPQLQVRLNDAQQAFASANPAFQTQLTNKYFAAFNEFPFTTQELEFAASTDPINVGLMPDSSPLAHIEEDGTACGVYVELLNAIAERSGLKFTYVMLPSSDVDATYLKDNNITLVAGIESNVKSSVSAGIHLSKPLLDMTKVYVGDLSRSYDLNGDIRVAVTPSIGSSIDDITAAHPHFEVKTYATTEKCLAAVQSGEADVVLQNRYVVERALASPFYNGLGVLPIQGISTDYALGAVDSVLDATYSDNDQDKLKSVINKSITQISEQTTNDILSAEVIENKYQPSFLDLLYQYRLPLGVIAISLAAVIAALSFVVRAQAKSRRAIEENEQKLTDITNNINGGVVVVNGDDSLLITYANDGFLSLIGCSREEFEDEYHDSYLAFIHPDDAESLKAIASKPISEQGERVSIPLRLRREDQTYLDTLFNGTIRVAADGKRQLYCVVTDISKQVSLLNELTMEKKRADLFFEKSDNVIYEVNLRDSTITATSNMREMLGWVLPSTLAGLTKDEFAKMWHTDDESKATLLDSTRKLMNELVDVSCTIPLENESGQKIWCEIDQYPVLDQSGALASVVGHILDVNDTMNEKARLERLARQDAMTGLLKKGVFVDEARAYLHSGETGNCALLFFDVDHFKTVNDTLGHDMGDECLKDVAQKLKVAFSSFDLIGRFGGDEFVVFVKDIPHDTLVDKLSWLQERMKQEYTNGRASVSVSCSIGAACSDDFGKHYSRLMKYADAALYEAKDQGRARFVMAQPDVPGEPKPQ